VIAIGIAFDVMTRSRLSATTALACDGEYSDSLQIQSLRNREIEQGPRSQFSYLVRSTAKYECPFFGPDSKLRRRRVQASELGSAFAYEQSGGDTYFLTNEHVAAWPEVTDTLHRIEGVPEGCKRVEDKLRIVRDERDDFEAGQIALQRVAVDPLLDGHPEGDQKLTVMPTRSARAPACAGTTSSRCAASRWASCRPCRAARSSTPTTAIRNGLGPRRLRDRRAAVGGNSGQPVLEPCRADRARWSSSASTTPATRATAR
jgi:hypothetical protein